MKKTLKLILATLFALLVLVSCENKVVEETEIKTALDYLAGKTIITTVELNTDNLDLEEDDLIIGMSYYMDFPVVFDANGELSAKGATIKDFEGSVEGMVYKTSFKQEYLDYDEEVPAYTTYEVDFKVLNENKVVISGSMHDEEYDINFIETEAYISNGNLPSWFTSDDWVFIPTEDLEEMPIDFSIFDKNMLFGDMQFGQSAMPAAISVHITSKNDVIKMAALMKAEIAGNKVAQESTYEFTKSSDDEAKLKVAFSYSMKDAETKVEEGRFGSFESTLKRIDRVPEWLEGTYQLGNSAHQYIPISNDAITDWFYDVVDFDRVCDEDSIEMTIIYTEEIYDEEYEDYVEVLCKDSITINKTASDDEFDCTYESFFVYEDGSEVLDEEFIIEDPIFTLL